MKISKDLLAQLFLPFMGMAEDEEYELCGVDDPEIIKRSLKTYFPPHLQEYDAVSQELLKATLAYYLRQDKFDFQDFWDSLLPPFELPQPPITLFRWTWEVLFPGESWRACYLDAVEDASVRSNILHEKKQS